MNLSALRIFALLTLLAFFVVGCNLPLEAKLTSSPDAGAAYTAAAETIAAQLTSISLPEETRVIMQTSETTQTQPGETTPTETFPPTSTPLPTRTPLLTDTPTPTDTPLPTSTPDLSAEDPAVRLGVPDWEDDFKTSENWPIYTDEHVEMHWEEGALFMKALNADKYEAWMLSWPFLTNFYLEVQATPGECSGADRYGLLARATDPMHAYVFGFTCDGKFALRYWNGKSFTGLIGWTFSEFILAGKDQTNRLGFLAEGAKISLYANGHLLAEISDETSLQGAFGLFVGAFVTPNFTVKIEKVSYWELP